VRLFRVSEVVALQLAIEVAVADGVGKAAVADAVDLDLDASGVDGDQRDALLAAAWQDIALAREVDHRLAVGDIDGERHLLGERFVDVGRQSGADLDLVALAMLDAIDAKLAAFDGDRLRVAAIDGDELREVVLAARQAFRELDADTRRRGVAIGRVVGHAEAVLGAELFIGVANARGFGERKAGFQGVDGGAPVGAALHGLTQHGERAGLHGGVGAQHVGAVGGARGVDGEVVVFGFVRIGLDGEQRLGEADPVFRALAVGDDGGCIRARGGACIRTHELFGGKPQVGGGSPVRFPGVANVGLVAVGVLGDALVGEDRFLGDRRRREGGGEKCHAEDKGFEDAHRR
jgi:hypothetical protein